MSTTNMTADLSAFVGRRQELSDLHRLLTASRLVTLTGVGGIGKTRLAQQAASSRLSDYTDGVWWVDLASVTSAGAVHDAVLRVVERPTGETFSGTLTDRIIETLGPRQLLLILDNCEQVRPAVAQLVLTLTQRCVGLRVLATSREALDIIGEQLFNVPPLPTPPPGTDVPLATIADMDAVKLFADRATQRRFSFKVTDENVADIGELCRRLEGIPLAIELAAARVAAMSPADLLGRLQSPLGLLESDALGHSERHRSLRRTIDWSYDLLEDDEKAIFRRAAVFAGGFDLTALERVCPDDDALNVVTRLVDKSLLSVTEILGHVRYRMLETIRAYAHELLLSSSEAAQVQERHAHYFGDFALHAGAGLTGPQEGEWITRVEAELQNLGAAIAWALSTYRITLATDLVHPLLVMQCAFDETIGAWSEMILEYPHPEQDPRRPGIALFACYVRYFYRGNTEAAQAVRELIDSTRLADAPIRLNVLNLACGLALINGWPFRPLTEEYLATAVAAADPFHLVHAKSAGTWAQLLAGEDPTAAAAEVVALARQLQNPSALAIALQAQGMACSRTAPAQALALLDESIAAAASVRSHFTQNVSESMRTTLLFNSLDTEEAVSAMLEALESPLGRSMPGLGGIGLVEVAALLALGGRADAACVLLGGVTGTGAPAPVLWPFAPKAFRGVLESLPGEVGEERWAALTRRGAAMSRNDQIAFARAECAELALPAPPPDQ